MIPKMENTSKQFLSFGYPLWFAMFLLCLITFPIQTFSQVQKTEDIDISINATGYFFAYNKGLRDMSYALGPTVTLNTKGKLSLQFGLLYDFKKYVYYERRLDNNTGIFYNASFEQVNLFIPLSLQFNYFRSEKITLYVVGGFLIGGMNIINENHIAEETSIYNLTLGTGISYRPLNWLALRTYPNLRYNAGLFFPGLSIDVAFLINREIRVR